MAFVRIGSKLARVGADLASQCSTGCPASTCTYCSCELPTNNVNAILTFSTNLCNTTQCGALDGTYVCARSTATACRWQYDGSSTGSGCGDLQVNRVRVTIFNDSGNTVVHCQVSINGISNCNYRNVLGADPTSVDCRFSNYVVSPTTIFHGSGRSCDNGTCKLTATT